MKTLRRADMASGLFLAGLGAVVIIAAFGITSAVAEKLPPRTLPLILGFTTTLTGLLLALRSWRFKGEDPVIDWPARDGWIRLIVSFVAVVVFLVLIEPIGLPLASLVYTTFMIWYLDRRIWPAVITGLATAAILLFVFIRFLELTFPTGPLTW